MKIISLLTLSLFFLLTSFTASRADIGPATLELVLSPDERPCTFFILNGMSGEWFGVNQVSPGYKEMVAMLLMAQASGRTVTVTPFSASDQQSYDPNHVCGVQEVIRLFVQ